MTVQPVDTFTRGAAPGRLPLLGHAWPLYRDTLRFLRALPRHGDLVRIGIGPGALQVICHPELAHEMLVDRARDFSKGGPVMDRSRTVLGDGLGTVDGPDHRRQRRLVQPAFQRARIAAYVPVMRDRVHALTAPWRVGEAIDAVREMGALTAEVTLSCLFDEPGRERGRAGGRHDIQAEVTALMDGLFLRMINPFPRLPVAGSGRYRVAERRMHTLIDETIARYRASREGGGLLRTMMASVDDEGRRFTDAELHDQSITLLMGGTETTAALLAWVWHLLDENPREERRLHAEVDEVLGGRDVTAADLPLLRHTRNVIAEALRLYPPGYLVTRRAVTDTRLGGIPVRAGTDLAYSPYILNRDARFFDHPDAFTPDRWADRPPPGRRSPYLPFGAGARRCVGDLFGLTESQVAVATIAQRWSLRRPPGAPPSVPLARMTLRPAPAALIAVPRRDVAPGGGSMAP
ncbi:cytochrome P450 [Streptomyces sp. NPDC057638]|uniref:cytochrome P450 n=1 Tax=Streptomyces sp. NPDC057638 TaxID=3346190 RepID=UPI0036BBCDB9